MVYYFQNTPVSTPRHGGDADFNGQLESLPSHRRSREQEETSDFFSGEFGQSSLRGNHKWAPPRPQLILKIHEKRKASAALADQGWLCRGCGLSVDPRYLRTFRYCAYFGAFFCTSCHSNRRSVIPAKIVQKWNFRE